MRRYQRATSDASSVELPRRRTRRDAPAMSSEGEREERYLVRRLSIVMANLGRPGKHYPERRILAAPAPSTTSSITTEGDDGRRRVALRRQHLNLARPEERVRKSIDSMLSQQRLGRHLQRDDRETKERRRRRQEGEGRYPVGSGPEVRQDGRLGDRRREKEDRWEESKGRREGTEKVGRRVIGRQGRQPEYVDRASVGRKEDRSDSGQGRKERSRGLSRHRSHRQERRVELGAGYGQRVRRANRVRSFSQRRGPVERLAEEEPEEIREVEERRVEDREVIQDQQERDHKNLSNGESQREGVRNQRGGESAERRHWEREREREEKRYVTSQQRPEEVDRGTPEMSGGVIERREQKIDRGRVWSLLDVRLVVWCDLATQAYARWLRREEMAGVARTYTSYPPCARSPTEVPVEFLVSHAYSVIPSLVNLHVWCRAFHVIAMLAVEGVHVPLPWVKGDICDGQIAGYVKVGICPHVWSVLVKVNRRLVRICGNVMVSSMEVPSARVVIVVMPSGCIGVMFTIEDSYQEAAGYILLGWQKG